MATPRRAAKQAEDSPVVEGLARLGLAARGVVWLVIGLLAGRIAFGGHATADKTGALGAIKSKPWGAALLVVLVLGFLGYAAWRLLEAAVGHTREKGRARWAKRAASLVRGAIYLGLAINTISFLVKGGGSDKTQPWTARVMGAPGGRLLVLLIGAGVVIGGLAMTVQAFRQTFEDRLDHTSMPAQLRAATRAVGTSGLASRGLVFALIGGFLFDAALRFDAGKAKGLDASLKTLAQQPFGRLALVAAALGLLAFAGWSFLEARYRKMSA